MRRIYDISPELSEHVAVFPGDVPFSREVQVSFEAGGNLRLSAIRSTVHVGAHTDAPNHYHPDGAAMHERMLEYYLGRAQVIETRVARGARLQPKCLEGKRIGAARVLFKTGSFPDPNRWNDDFNSLSPELVDTLHRSRVILVGIDTPSIDPPQSEALESHQAVYRNDMAILEGIVLTHVPEGVYQLAALPLKIRGADASPVRAVLWRDEPAPTVPEAHA